MVDDFYQLALAAIRHHLNEADVAYEVDEGEIIVDGHRLGLSITFEGFVSQGNQIIAPLDVQLHLDGDAGDRFRVGTLGIGSDRSHAMQSAVAEWHLLAAAPVLAALGAPVSTRRSQPIPQQLAGWKMFPGRVGIRGRMPAALEAGGAFYRQLLDTLRQTVSKWEDPGRFELKSIYIMVASGPEGTEVQAAVDGYVDEGLTKSLSALDWPQSTDAYLYKQLFVFRADEK